MSAKDNVEKIFKSLEDLKERNRSVPIVVEGKNDVIALRKLNKEGFLFLDVINGFNLKRRTYDISEFNDGDMKIYLKMRAKKIKDHYDLRYSYSIFDRTKRNVEKTITIYPITLVELGRSIPRG